MTVKLLTICPKCEKRAVNGWCPLDGWVEPFATKLHDILNPVDRSAEKWLQCWSPEKNMNEYVLYIDWWERYLPPWLEPKVGFRWIRPVKIVDYPVMQFDRMRDYETRILGSLGIQRKQEE